MGLNARVRRIDHAATLRQAVQDMRPLEALEYALNAFEDLAGHLGESPLAEVGNVRLTKQQSQIFAVLQKNLGKAVSLGGLLSVMSAGSPTSETSIGSLRAQIFFMRRKLTGHFTIQTIYNSGYLMEPA